MTHELGQVTEPTLLVPGDPDAIMANARFIRERAVRASETGEALKRIDAGGWSGEAADLWHEQHQTDVPRWFDGGDSLAAGAAALEEYARVLRWAQAEAAEAARLWAEGEAATEQAKLDYEKAVADAQGGAVAPFVDPGAERRQAAQDMLRAARQELAGEGDRAAFALREEAAVAPQDSQAQIDANFYGALWEGFSGTFTAFYDAFSDPLGTVKAMAYAATHPVETFKEMVSWNDFANGRGEVGLGRITGEVIGGVLTGGIGKILKTLKKLPDAPEHRVPVPERQTTGDPIDVATGSMVLAQTDVELPGLLPLVLKRLHLSSFRAGQHFGPTWASTLDQRLELDGTDVCFVADDGTLSLFPQPAQGASADAVTGPQRRLARFEGDAYTITDVAQGRTLHFGPAGEIRPLTAIVDRSGQRIDVERDADGVPVEVRHSGGYRIRVDSDAGLVTALHLRDADDGDDVLLMRYGYEDQRLTEVINASGLPLRFTYDESGRITSWTDRNDKWYRYVYDDGGRVVEVEGSGGFFSGTLEYDHENRITCWTDSQGARTEYHLNEAGQTVREVDAQGGEIRSEWDDRDRLLSRTDQLGRTVRHEYDEVGNLVAVTRPDGSQTRIEYDDLRLPVTIIAPDGAVTRREHDERGNVVRSVDALGAVTTYAYDERGHLASFTDALGNVRRVETDAAGLPVVVTDPMGNATRYARDGFGRVAEVVDPLGGTTRFGWTVDGKPAWRTSPDGATERWLYDGEGNLRTFVDALGQETHTEVTHFDLPSAEIRPDGTRLEFDYDTELRLVAVTNEQGLVWRYDYDVVGNLAREIDFNGRAVTYRHDAAGQLIERTNGAGETTSFSRDVLGNVIERRNGSVTSTFTYDPLGRLLEAMDGDTQVTFERDPAGRVLAETINGRTVASVYDPLGRRIRRRTPSGAESVWEYGPNGRPSALHTAGRTLRFGYDRAGHEVQRDLGPDVVLAQAWNANHQLLSQTLDRAGQQVQRRSYTYRADGYLTGLDDKLTGPRTFDLDRLGRITAVNGPGWSERYAYDAAGNLAHASWPTSDPEELGDREYSGTLIRRAGKVRYEHDAQGRVVLRQRKRLSRKPDTWRYFWDADDRLTEVLTPDGARWHYRYDPLGRRVAKQRLTPDGSRVLEQIEFIWDAAVLAEQAHTDGLPNGPHLLDARVTVWNHEPGTFRPLTQAQRSAVRNAPQRWIDEQFHSIITDLVGTPTELIDDQGAVSWHRRTTLWGVTPDQSRAGAYTPLRFPGQYHDPETGFNYNYHRHYDPNTGRYASNDPLGLAASPRPQSYVSNPSRQIDPFGLVPCPDDSKLPGSGPIPGVLEVSERVKSVGAVENFFPKGERDFVFDPVQNRFVTGSEQGILGHDGLRESIGGNPSDVVGGRLSRGPNGEFLTNEWSGHYGHQWTPEIRQKFVEFMGEYGLEVAHTPWRG
ncbi:RHS repeat-associated core domain-containing protein [Saccharopolyspora kobensis]|uniref:RHS repeat-associated core domain-containing protein n=1 Tax=Saccharopolyspora kobensis TaxID=146035 RepID=A0A1H6CU97_9PSEU|nr:polymorphic toxin type 43 domain-containing protein [Saccharopolyspora kobensis]SEG76243.1 RHS repeat-associated core domain-containing protein [Saccharopolyspora kobensis]SFC98830.1 RHS repeat-associated core domain-containing protein [Saccharopolyspora kobensis]